MTTPIVTKSNLHRTTLHRLLADFAFLGDVADCEITGLATDSRVVKSGDLYFALGSVQSGKSNLDYIRQALRQGAAAVVVDEKYQTDINVLRNEFPHPIVVVADVDWNVGKIAARYFAFPTADMRVIGVTGTNGKTSTTQFVAQCLQAAGMPCGLIGTLGLGVWGKLKPSLYTTPPALDLQKEFSELRDANVRHAVMEVSSHGLHQGRVEGVNFELAVFTNLTHDHLDYHGDMAAYAKAKQQLFFTPGLRATVLNIDDEFGRDMVRIVPNTVRKITYSLHDGGLIENADAYVYGRLVAVDMQGMHLDIQSTWGNGELRCRLLGSFNAANVLAVLASLLALDVNFQQALAALGTVTPPPGRMERFGAKQGRPLVVVDYAHTPDALEKVLLTLRSHCEGELWVVFGCGGDRDRAKRPRMGDIAARLADRVVITDDNPRTEVATQIVADVLAGVTLPQKVSVEHDRRKAISLAVNNARGNDVVLVAGKGHEDYQIVGKERRHFSDQEVVKALLQEAA